MEFFVFFVVIVVFVGIFGTMEGVKNRREREARIRALKIADVDSMAGIDFEQYVCRLLRHQGYAAEVTKASGDFGVDILASRNNRKTAFQVKRYSKKVSNKAVNEAFAGMAHYKCDQCAVVTNNYFTPAAIKLAESTKCLLIDRELLTNWILDFQSLDDAISYTTDALLNDVPLVDLGECENLEVELVLRELGEIQCEYDSEPANFTENRSLSSRTDNIHNTKVSVDSKLIRTLMREAEFRFPKDYSTQVFVVKQQIEAYKAIESFRAHDIPDDELNGILVAAANRWGNDFATAKYVIDEQVAAFRQLQAIAS